MEKNFSPDFRSQSIDEPDGGYSRLFPKFTSHSELLNSRYIELFW